MHFPNSRHQRAAVPKRGTNPNGLEGKIMKRIIALTTAALMGASVMAAPALAQSNTGAMPETGATSMPESGATTMPQTGAQTGTTGASPDIDTGTTAAIGADFNTALTAIEGNAASAAAIGSISDVERVNVVQLSTLEGHNSTALDESLAVNEAGVEELKSSIQANSAMSSELATQGVNADDIVAAQVASDGEVTVYVR
jgi:hypothetical protein